MFKIFFIPKKKTNKIKTPTKILKIKTKLFFYIVGPTRMVPRSYVFPFGKSGIT